MVTIVDFALRENAEAEPFYALILQSGIEMVKSKETVRFYATAKRASIPSTFDESYCKQAIGTQMPGSIKKVETEPYEFTIRERGEVIILKHRWEYSTEGETLEENVFQGKPVEATY